MESNILTKKILILNGGYSEIPLIKAAKKEGFYVIVTGKNEKAPGNSLADEYVRADYSDKEEICSLAKQLDVCAICSGCTDFSYLSAAYACEKLGLKGHDSYETAKILHHKSLYREFAHKAGILAPKSVVYSDEKDLEALRELKYPVLVKPIDLFSGMGIKKCNSLEDVLAAIEVAKKVTRESSIVVEEFLEGTNHGFTTIIRNKKVVFYMADNELHDYNEYAVSGAYVPSDVPESALCKLINDAEVMARELDLVDGLLHIQFILTKDNEPVILEVCRRSPGDLYIELVKKATNVDYPEIILKCESGLPIYDIKQQPVVGNWLRQVAVCNEEGVIDSFNVDDELEAYIDETKIFLDKGHEIKEGQTYKCGVLFLKFDTANKMRQEVKNITKRLKFKLTREKG